MSDVDAIRWMASEHDLEFVDLDTYGVDPAAGEILPASLSRRHHVVAIKRKFGTPVIATADPDDLAAHDMVRAAIGRDFISVVASRDQIGEHLDRLFGSDQGEQRTDPAGQSAGASTGSGRATPDAEADSDTANVRAADADESLLTSDDIDVGAKGSSPRHDEPKAKRRTTKKSVDRAVEDAESLDLPADPSGPATRR